MPALGTPLIGKTHAPDQLFSINCYLALDMKESDTQLSYTKYCADNASVWKRYMRRAEHDDRELAQILNSDLESLLLFVSRTLPSL